MAPSNGGDPPPQSSLPPWLAGGNTNVHPPSVTLSLSPSSVNPPISWLHTDNNPHSLNPNPLVLSELVDCCQEVEEGHSAWAAHKKEAAWRLKRVELQLESEKACRRREKIEDVEAKVKALREEQKAALDRIDAEYREQLAGLRMEAQLKEQKLADQWAAKHIRLTKFLDQIGCRSIAGEHNTR